jgi:glutathione synthase/RimK-type ligase-like ATP-grasp enzyme
MILLWGIAADGPLASVRAALMRMGAPVAFLDQQSLLRARIELTLDGGVRGRLETPEWTADLESVTAAYLRPYDARRTDALRGLKLGSSRLRRALEFEDALACWTEMTPALVVSRPSAMASNNSKPYQLGLIRQAGFDVPDTLVTTDPSAAAEFWERHGAVIYKSVSGFRSIVSRLRPEHRDRLPDVANCPTQFQQYVDGVDYRVHVVGGEAFGCQVSSSADDYRYPQESGEPRVQSWEVPEDLARRCLGLADSLNLPVVGIDLRRTSSGKWYCFEANPSPGFSFYEEATGQPISEAIARLLARPAAP